jgi:hypothetical protein
MHPEKGFVHDGFYPNCARGKPPETTFLEVPIIRFSTALRNESAPKEGEQGMKKKNIIAAIILVCIQNFLAATNSFEITIGFSPGALIDGFQQDIPRYSLSPQPDSYPSIQLEAGLRYFFFDFMGLEVSSYFLHITYADSKLVSDPLPVFDSASANIGVVLRSAFHVFGTVLVAYISGGGNFNFIWYDQKFKELMPVILYDIDPFFGCYAKMGIEYYLNPQVFFGIGFLYVFSNAIIGVTNTQLEGHYLRVPIYLGVSFH